MKEKTISKSKEEPTIANRNFFRSYNFKSNAKHVLYVFAQIWIPFLIFGFTQTYWIDVCIGCGCRYTPHVVSTIILFFITQLFNFLYVMYLYRTKELTKGTGKYTLISNLIFSVAALLIVIVRGPALC